jgi:hypothetical protein
MRIRRATAFETNAATRASEKRQKAICLLGGIICRGQETSINDGDTRTYSYGKRWAILDIVTQVKRVLGSFASSTISESSFRLELAIDYITLARMGFQCLFTSITTLVICVAY